MIDVKNFDLSKKVEKLDRFLLTKGLRTAPTMRVGLAADISGSMLDIIRSGGLQKAFNQLMAPAVKFDDNGELDVFKFDDRCEYVGTATPEDFENYVERNGIRARGATNYAPIVTETLKFFFGLNNVSPAKKSLLGMFSKSAPAATANNSPVLVLIVTDGECGDRAETERALVEAQKYNIYFHFVAVGRASFPTIKYLADKLPNVGDVYLRDFGMSDDEVYEQIVSDELVGWIKTK